MGWLVDVNIVYLSAFIDPQKNIVGFLIWRIQAISGRKILNDPKKYLDIRNQILYLMEIFQNQRVFKIQRGIRRCNFNLYYL